MGKWFSYGIKIAVTDREAKQFLAQTPTCEHTGLTPLETVRENYFPAIHFTRLTQDLI